MPQQYVRVVLFIGLAAFVPLFYYLAVVGGLLPLGGMLLLAMRNPDPAILGFTAIHLAIYGLLLYWLAGLLTRLLVKIAGGHVWFATATVMLLLAGVAALPIFGIAHGHIRWINAYELYGSNALR
jgi:hypothetical protein